MAFGIELYLFSKYVITADMNLNSIVSFLLCCGRTTSVLTETELRGNKYVTSINANILT